MFTPQRFVVRTSLTGYGRLASIVCLTLLLYATSSSNCSTFAQTEKTKRELPSLTLLGNETRALLRQEAVLKSGPEKKCGGNSIVRYVRDFAFGFAVRWQQNASG